MSYLGEPSVRLTRARAALCQKNGAITSRELSKEPVHKAPSRGNSKRSALDEKEDKAPLIPCSQHKRKEILKDITNVTCESPHRKCLKKNQMHGKGSLCYGFKLAPSTSVQRLMVDNAKCMPRQAENVHLQLSVVTSNSTNNLPLHSRLEKSGEGSGKESLLKNQQGDSSLHNGKSAVAKMPDPIDIDTDHMDPQSCSIYAPDIYQHFQALENIRRPSSTYMERVQQDINPSMRGVLVDWLVEVCDVFMLVPNTLYLTVHLVDAFLSQEDIERQHLQLLGITCMLIASKYEEICAPSIDDLCHMTANSCTKREVIALEIKVLNTLGFRLSFPTVKTFLRRFVHAAQSSYSSSNLEFEFLANYLAESTLVHYGFLKFLPSAIAASAVFLARWTLHQSDHPWNPTLEYYTTYKSSDLKTIVHALRTVQLISDKCPFPAVRAKYHEDKFRGVSALTSPELPDLLFRT